MPAMASQDRSRTAVAALAAARPLAALAVAACLFDAAGLAGEQAAGAPAGRVLMQLTPASDFTPSDGRQMDVPAWRINAEIAQRVIARFNPAQPLVVDYEHQTLHAEANGQPAPAAGWIHALRWIEGRGLFGEVELTARARQLVAEREYLYFSPVFEYDRQSGEVKRLFMGAITNNPALHGMQAVDLTAAASARFTSTVTPQENDVTLLEKLLQALGLPAGSDEEAVLAAVAELVKPAKDGAGDGAAGATAAATAAVPDPSQYVPVAAVQQLQASVAALTASAREREVNDLVGPALADGRLLPALEAWARELGRKDVAALSAYLAKAQPIAALTGAQTGGQPPAAKDANGLSADERAVAAACGLTPEQFAAGRATA